MASPKEPRVPKGPSRRRPVASTVRETPTRRARKPSALVASAARIKLKDQPRTRRVEDWQAEAWGFFDNIGEIKYAMNYIANALAKLRLFPALVPDDPQGIPVPDDTPEGHAALASLKGPGGGYAEILREAAINLLVPGECYLVGTQGEGDRKGALGSELTASSVESWDIRSIDEISFDSSGRMQIREVPNGKQVEWDDSNSIVIRIWFRHPRFSQLADSPMRGILSSCEEIQRIERVIRGAAKSRAAGPGLLLVPDEISFGNPDPTTESSGDGEAYADPFNAVLIESMVTPIQNEGSASSVVPLVVRAPADLLDKIRRVDLSINVEAELLKLDRALTRLAQGLPVPPEIVTGKADLSHWTSWQVAEDVISAHVEPLAVPILNALTEEFYRVYLQAAGLSESEAASRMLWYDPTPLIVRPNRSADADFGLDHIALSDVAWRRIKGFTEQDAPSAIEKITRLVLQRGSFDPVFTSVLLEALGLSPASTREVINLPPVPQPSAPPPASPNGPPEMRRPRGTAGLGLIVASAASDPIDVGSRLLEIDRDLKARLHSSCDAAVRRALERACSTIISRLRNNAHFSSILSDRPKLEAAAAVGQAQLVLEGLTSESLLNGSFDQVCSRFVDWAIRAYSRAFRALGLPLPEADIAARCADASAWLRDALTLHTTERLFTPDPPAELFGELDDTSAVPYSIVREAVARAGGLQMGSLTSPDRIHPFGGIATGEVVLDALREAGGDIEGWEWHYGAGPRTREYEAHRDLDGIRFSRRDDPALSNAATWPPVLHHSPGDHSSCSCEWRPVLLLAVEETA